MRIFFNVASGPLLPCGTPGLCRCFLSQIWPLETLTVVHLAVREPFQSQILPLETPKMALWVSRDSLHKQVWPLETLQVVSSGTVGL